MHYNQVSDKHGYVQCNETIGHNTLITTKFQFLKLVQFQFRLIGSRVTKERLSCALNGIVNRGHFGNFKIANVFIELRSVGVY